MSGRRSVGVAGSRGLQIRKALVELRRILQGTIGQRCLSSRCFGDGQQHAHHHAQRDIDDIVTRATAIRESGDVASDHAKIVLRRRCNCWRARVQAHHFRRGHGGGLVQAIDAGQKGRNQISTREAVFQLLRDMEHDLDTYLALSSPEASDWPQETKLLAGTLRTFNVRQPYPLLLAAKRVFDAPDFAGLMRACVVISMRFNVICGYSTAEQERTYNAVSERVAKEEIKSLGAALAAMLSIYPNDAAFRAAFAEKTIRTTQSRNNRVVRYILCALEKHLSGHDYSFTSDSFNIEHVLPQHPESGWEAFSNEEVDALAYRLGNMTLMQSGANKDLGNAAYAAKRPVFQQSGFAITAKLAADHAEWTPERIAAHQNWMAAQASAIWRIAQMG